jgi:hypothetical protein
MKNAAISLISIAILLVQSCGIYTFSPSALGGIKTIAISTFANKTNEYGIDDLITSEVNQAFVNDNTLKVVPTDRADVILYGEVSSYAHDPYTYDETETVREYICRITINVKVEYSNSEKILWQDENLSDYGIYSVVDGQTQDDGNITAIGKLVNEIMNRTVKGW